MPKEENTKTSWANIGVKVVPPIVTGVLIAWAGFVGNMVLSSISNQQESARLITELQIKREQAESQLRKDVFDQALESFLLKKETNLGTINDLSKQLLRLEMLALNFGDSLSLSPLFNELNRDLDRAISIKDEKTSDYSERKAELSTRLESLAKRVARSQLSSIAQHGEIIEISIPLYEYKKKDFEKDCKKNLYVEQEYVWPKFELLRGNQFYDEEYNLVKEQEKRDSYDSYIQSHAYKNDMQERNQIELNGIKRYLELHVKDVNPCNKSAEVLILIKKDGDVNLEVNQAFRLDYFNFPMVDNTRLSDNQRFAIVMESFELTPIPCINIKGIIFPSEYACLRDRPGMKEARKLLESAMKSEKDDKR